MRCELRQTNIRYKQNQHLKNECPTTSEEEQEGYQGAESQNGGSCSHYEHPSQASSGIVVSL